MSGSVGRSGAGDPRLDLGGQRSELAASLETPTADPGPPIPGAAAPLLEVEGLSRAFSGVLALQGYSLRLEPLAIHGVIGPNGAGKTTLFNLLTGFLTPTEGTIRFLGQNITRRPAHEIARLGMARTFQNIRLFGQLSVIENVKPALQSRMPTSPLATLLSTPGFRRQERELEVGSMELLELVGLAHLRDRIAKSLPYGDQRRLEIARAIALSPKVLLLDEPNAGMNASETADILELIRKLRDQLKITIVMVAHDIPLVMNLCDRIQVLNYGKLIAEGDPAAVRNNPEVIAAYLGQRGAVPA
jgi:branched-chain amino acid transport system ATP-binding protein